MVLQGVACSVLLLTVLLLNIYLILSFMPIAMHLFYA